MPLNFFGQERTNESREELKNDSDWKYLCGFIFFIIATAFEDIIENISIF